MSTTIVIPPIRTRGRGYRLGYAAIELGQRALRSLHLREFFHPLAADIARGSGETCFVFALNEFADRARVVDQVESARGVRVSISIGHLLPLHVGIAKVLLAHLPEGEQAHVIAGIDPAALPAPRGEFERQLAEIREAGWCASSGEIEAGTWGVGAVVLAPSGAPVAAFGVIGPAARETPEHEAHLAELLLGAARAAEERLGFR